ncbi:T9SS type A sorting domain-containing protein [bacterium]|nr:T9SS type A sorting domain-containing protein [bacterium]
MKRIALLLTLMLFATATYANWGIVETPYYGNVTQIEELPSGGLLIGTSAGIFASTNQGESWFFTGLGSMDDPNAGNDVHFDALELEDGTVFIAMENVFHGTTALNDFQLVDWRVFGIESTNKSGNNWLIATSLEIYYSSDNGRAWNMAFEDTGLWDDIISIEVNPVDQTAIAHMQRANGIWLLISEDNGVTWTEQQIPGVFGEMFDPQFDDDGTLYFGNNYQNQGHLHTTTDYGLTVNTFYSADAGFQLSDLERGDNGEIAAFRNAGILFSTDGGENFNFVTPAYPRPSAMILTDDLIITGGWDGVFRSDDTGNNWENSTTGLTAFTINDSEVDDNGNVWLLTSSSLFQQTDEGWNDLGRPWTEDLPPSIIQFTSTGRFLAMGRNSDNRQVDGYFSDDDGETWTQMDGFGMDAEGYGFTSVIESDNGTIYAGHEALGLFSSTDNGASWNHINSEAVGTLRMAGDGSLYFSSWQGVKRSSDGGNSWTTLDDIGTPGANTASPVTASFIVQDWMDIERTLDGGATWMNIFNNLQPAIEGNWISEVPAMCYNDEGDLYVSVIAENPQTYRKTTYILKSDNDGTDFVNVTGRSSIKSAVVENLRLTSNGGVAAHTNMGWFGEEIEVDVQEGQVIQPITFSLSQNYPNPFNPTTTIQFSLSSSAFAKLTVYDMMGREISQLVNQTLSRGQHEVQFDASTLASGVYLYRLQSGKQTITNRMYLIK